MKNITLKLGLILLLGLVSNASFAERTTTYMHSDALGSVIAASDEDGNLLWRKQYQPFGSQIEGSNESEEVSYTGKKFDKATGLSYYGARYYDPHMGRFTSVDPVGVLGSVESNPMMFNRYAYANNNPYKYVDPDGRAPDHIMDIRHAGLGQFAAENPKSAAVMVGFAITAPFVSAGTIAYGPAALAACTATCSTITAGAVVGGGLEGLNQVQSGEFSSTELATSVMIGMAGGGGSLVGKNLTQNILGAAGGASGATLVTYLPAVANDEIGASQALLSAFQNGASAVGGTVIGATTARMLKATTRFGGLDKLSNGGAALGASSGEIGAATAVNLLTSDDE